MTFYKNIKTSVAGLALLSAGFVVAPAMADQVILDDLIVDGSICAGFDCVNGESFGFDTLRLKENNLRIKFQDTSTSASFPTNDWQLTANATSNGGGNFFAIDDIDGGRTPFKVEAGAPSNSLLVDDGGRIGFGTANPVVQLHLVDGNTPTLRLEQDGSSGFTAQTWDMAGNEANFFIRDATNGSTLPFRIEPGAATNSIVIDASDDVGIGTNAPTKTLHVRRTNGTAGLLVEEASVTDAPRVMTQLKNNGVTILQLTETTAGDFSWNIQARKASENNDFRIVNSTGVGEEFILETDGDLTITGTLTEMSDVNSKTAIVPVDSSDVLERVASLPISAWTYKHDVDDGTRHIGPMAQDFYGLFGTGASDKGISSLDTSGVALAAIQALHAENTELRARLTALENTVSQ